MAISLPLLPGCTKTFTREDRHDAIDDSVITSKVQAAILNEASLQSAKIKVVTFVGQVRLSGMVRSVSDEDKAVDVARGIKGVTSVENDMHQKSDVGF